MVNSSEPSLFPAGSFFGFSRHVFLAKVDVRSQYPYDAALSRYSALPLLWVPDPLLQMPASRTLVSQLCAHRHRPLRARSENHMQPPALLSESKTRVWGLGV